LICVSSKTNAESFLTYGELHCEVQRFVAALISMGVGKGDRVVIYMPMIAEAVIAMLACVRIGAIHSVVFGGFASGALASNSNVFYNTGHGHLDCTLSAITADMVVEVIAEAHPGRVGFNGFQGRVA
jgi:acyl-coenzyme A synthetase/AMP-(fatty) acid ligase